MTAIYLLRHPETTWNAAQRYQGRLEAPLSPAGQAQIPRLCGAFAGDRLAAVYSSPLQRALALAAPLARTTGAPLCVEQRLTEIAQGPWEGLYRSQIARDFPHLLEQWHTHPELMRFPHGEDLAAVRRRAMSVLTALFQRYPDQHVAVVTHSVVIQVTVASVLGLDLVHVHSIRVSNAGITILCGQEPPGSLLTLNSTTSLHESPVRSASAQDCVSWKERRVTQ